MDDLKLHAKNKDDLNQLRIVQRFSDDIWIQSVEKCAKVTFKKSS